MEDKGESLIGVELSDFKPQEIKRRIQQVPNQLRDTGNQGKEWILSRLLEISYRNLHISYFLIVGFIGGILLFLFKLKNTNTSFIDALFLSFSSICLTGLLPRDIHGFRTISYILIMILTQAGSIVMLTLTTLIIRRHFFRKRFFRGDMTDLPVPSSPTASYASDSSPTASPQMSSGEEQVETRIEVNEAQQSNSEQEQRQVEYNALSRLMIIVAIYIIFIYSVSIMALSIWAASNSSAKAILEREGIHNAFWFGLFTTVSAFNNAGFTLTQDGMIPFQNSRFILLWVGGLIALGNTLFPIVLRLIIYICRRVSKNPAPYKILLVRPRTLFTHLFPATETRVLFLVWMIITITQFSLILAIGFNSAPLNTLQPPLRALSAFFLSLSTRTGGFNTLDINQFSPGIIIVFLVLMYIAAYPFVITLRGSTLVSDQQIQGFIDAEDEEASKVDRSVVTGMRLKPARKARGGMKGLVQAISFHTQSLFFQHIVWLFLVWFLISAVESKSAAMPFDEVFKTFFEISSAYGTVGLSLGQTHASHSSVFGVFGKLLIISVMFLGRHRGLPSSLDPAIDLYQFSRRKEKDMNKHQRQIDEDGGEVIEQNSVRRRTQT